MIYVSTLPNTTHGRDKFFLLLFNGLHPWPYLKLDFSLSFWVPENYLWKFAANLKFCFLNEAWIVKVTYNNWIKIMHQGFMDKYTNNIIGRNNTLNDKNIIRYWLLELQMFDNVFQMQTSDICRIVGLLSLTAMLKSLWTRYSFMVNGPQTNAGTNDIYTCKSTIKKIQPVSDQTYFWMICH